MKQNVLITGGTGLIGTALQSKLLQRGFSVSILSRSKKSIDKVSCYQWNVKEKYIDKKAIENADYIIHLAGTNIGDKRWTSGVKKDIIQSRKDSTELLYEYVKEHNPNLKAFISSSAVGYYGMQDSEKVFVETDSAGKDFLAKVCLAWEKNVAKIEALNIRSVIIRTGVVLSKQDGALEQMAKPVKLGVGAAIGSGKQYIPWIHIDDICRIYINAMQYERYQGVYNGVSPEHINNKDFTKAIAKVLHKPCFLPNVPAIVLKFALGERAVLALKGNKVSAEKIIANGFRFEYTNSEIALTQLLKT